MAGQCAGCGATNLDDANFCEECGRSLQSEVGHSPLGGVAAEIVCDRAIARITK